MLCWGFVPQARREYTSQTNTEPVYYYLGDLYSMGLHTKRNTTPSGTLYCTEKVRLDTTGIRGSLDTHPLEGNVSHPTYMLLPIWE